MSSRVVSCKVKEESLCLPQLQQIHNSQFPNKDILHSPYGDKWSYGYFRRYYTLDSYSYSGDIPSNCTGGQNPVYPSTDCQPEPEPHQCPDSGTFVDKTWGREGLNGWSTCRSDNCVVAAQVDNHSSMPSGVCYVNDSGKRICRYDLFYTGQACTYNPDGGTGINPPDHEYPTDPVKPPNPDNPPPSPDLPDEGGDVTPPIYDPDAEDDGLPDDPVQPPNPDPTPDPDDPNLSDGDNAVVGELSEANQRLENIDHTLQDLTNTTKSDNDALIEYQSHLLGEMKQMNQQLADGVGSGGGGGNGDGNGEGSCEGEDCNPVGFPGAPEVVDPFAEILDETDINDILTRTEEVKTQLQTQMNNFKGLFRVPDYGTGGDIAPVEFDLKHAGTTIPVKFGIFSQISADISSIIVMIAAFIAFLIVTTRR
ncbi:hypothetical protein NB476_06675 [Vibrio sp. RM-44-3]|uniref:hypothetical protein n=1 Tax=Vibrio sp. RM-44-3 TaxID=2950156 RepID=UPI00215D0F0F|nr:hypothetical protein [Vibrio sp. RM-44-3]MCR9622016.1 hypothetical protein [Vibrio sp. RM-44-3]